jgi:hypothetical protein
MRPQIWMLAGLANDTDVDLSAGLLIDGVVRFLLAFDPGNRRLSAQLPPGIGVANMRNVLMATFAIGLCDAINLKLRHGNSPPRDAT